MILITGFNQLIETILRMNRLYKEAVIYGIGNIEKKDITDNSDLYQTITMRGYDTLAHVVNVNSINGGHEERYRRLADNTRSMMNLVRLARNIDSGLIYAVCTGQLSVNGRADYIEKLSKLTTNIPVKLLHFPDVLPELDKERGLLGVNVGAVILREVIEGVPSIIDYPGNKLLKFTTPTEVINIFEKALTSELNEVEIISNENEIIVAVETFVNLIKEVFPNADISYIPVKLDVIIDGEQNIDILKTYLQNLAEIQNAQTEPTI